MCSKSLYVFLIGVALMASCQSKDNAAYITQLSTERLRENELFFDPTRTPLDSVHFATFKGLKYFPIDPKWRVDAQLEKTNDTAVFDLPHSHDRSKPYRKYGYITFSVEGKECKLLVLEAVIKKKGYENYLLVSFTDETSGKSTYGGGRYLDFNKSLESTVILDFNTAYNPYCAYGGNFTCPIPPKENHLPIAIDAGMKAPEE